MCLNILSGSKSELLQNQLVKFSSRLFAFLPVFNYGWSEKCFAVRQLLQSRISTKLTRQILCQNKCIFFWLVWFISLINFEKRVRNFSQRKWKRLILLMLSGFNVITVANNLWPLAPLYFLLYVSVTIWSYMVLYKVYCVFSRHFRMSAYLLTFARCFLWIFWSWTPLMDI